MQFSRSLSMLLSTLIITLSFINATPILEDRVDFVTVPVKRFHPHTKGVPLQIRSEQLVNRAVNRLARMSGRDAPPAELLERNLMRRVLDVEGPEGFAKRFNGRSLDEFLTFEKRSNRYHPHNDRARGKGKKQKHNKKQNAKSPKATPNNPLQQGDAPTAANSLALAIETPDLSYLATFQVGTPPKDFTLLMDSGSADFWIGSEDCKSTSGGGCGQHTFLGSQGSKSFADTGKQWSITYGSGSAAGTIVTDNVVVANLSLPKHTFGVANTESVDFAGDGFPGDGLVGLAQSSLSQQKTATPVEALAASGQIKEAITSYKLGRTRDNDNNGEITFGGLDPTKFDPKTLVTVKNVNKQGFWEVAVDDATVNGQSLNLQGRTAILDTGTTFGILPLNDAKALHSQIPGAKFDGQSQFTVPCDTKASVALTIGGHSFKVDPRDVAFQPANGGNDFSTGDCVSGFAAGNIGGATEWLMGDTFLKNVYYSTDVGKNAISLAEITPVAAKSQ